MGELYINDISAGMALAEDVVNLNGMPLLKAGTILTDKHLTALKMWGITEADICGVEREALGEASTLDADPEALKRVESGLNDLFQKTDLKDPVMSEIYRLVKKRKLGELGHEQGICRP